MSHFDKILVPVDGSAPSNAGVAFAIDLAKQYSGAIVFVNVVELGALAATSDYVAIDPSVVADEARAEGAALVSAAMDKAKAAGIKAEGRTSDGPTIDALNDAIKKSGATSAVICSHGRGGISRAILGSTTEEFLRHATVPVIVVPHVLH
jgi:nucleotide-binding universal stress UspA family protein